MRKPLFPVYILACGIGILIYGLVVHDWIIAMLGVQTEIVAILKQKTDLG